MTKTTSIFNFSVQGAGADITVRGAISYDKFYVDKENNLFFGEALLEAYEYGEAQNWIGYVLTPSAENKLKEMDLPPEERLFYAYEDIPYHTKYSYLKQNLPACIIGNWVGSNGKNGLLKKLDELKGRIKSKSICEKYDNAISFINKHQDRMK